MVFQFVRVESISSMKSQTTQYFYFWGGGIINFFTSSSDASGLCSAMMITRSSRKTFMENTAILQNHINDIKINHFLSEEKIIQEGEAISMKLYCRKFNINRTGDISK